MTSAQKQGYTSGSVPLKAADTSLVIIQPSCLAMIQRFDCRHDCLGLLVHAIDQFGTEVRQVLFGSHHSSQLLNIIFQRIQILLSRQTRYSLANRTLYKLLQIVK